MTNTNQFFYISLAVRETNSNADNNFYSLGAALNPVCHGSPQSKAYLRDCL